LQTVSRPVPDFNLEGVNGEQWNKEALSGKPWIINFWAVWCAPCLHEIPSLNRAWGVLEDKGVGMLAINIGDDAEGIKTFLVDNDLTIDFPIVVGDKFKSLENWSARNLPFTVIVGPDGEVLFEAVGPREWDDQRFLDVALSYVES